MPEPTTSLADAQESLESVIKGEVLRMYEEVADHPESEFHFYHGREAAEIFGYRREWLDPRAERGRGLIRGGRQSARAQRAAARRDGGGPRQRRGGWTDSSPAGRWGRRVG